MLLNEIIGLKSKSNKIEFFKVNEIFKVKSFGSHCFFYINKDKRYSHKVTLRETYDKLKPFGFLKINRNCILKLSSIKSLRSNGSRYLVVETSTGEEIKVSSSCRSQLKDLVL